MLQTLDLLGFLTLGVLGGFGHCVGMCMPFVLFVGRRYGRPGAGRAHALKVQLYYAAGRITIYVAMGAAAGGLGSAVELAGNMMGIQRAASVVAGIALILYALVSLLEFVPGLTGSGGLIFGRVAGLLKRRVPGHPLLMGLLLGFLPCGLVYSAVIAAGALGSPAQGAAGLALFGLGTVPAMLGVSVADELLVRHRNVVNRLSQAVILVMGLWFTWKGLAGP
jgi:uncharacterized protein